MKRGIRISLILVIGVILAAAGVIGLLQGPGLVQYTFLPGEETVSTLLEELGTMQEALKDSFPVITLRITTKAQQSTCLIPASAVRGSGDSRFIYYAEQEESAFAGKKITVKQMPVKVLAENASTVSIDEDVSYYKIIYMEDRHINEGDTVMQYEE